jgi:diguanylate cyclase (GGDEF)-like protein
MENIFSMIGSIDGKGDNVIRSKYKFFLTIISSIICAVMVCFYLFSIDKVGDIYIGSSKKVICSIKKDFLKDTVNNLVSEIDIKRNKKSANMEKFIARTVGIIDMKMDLTDEEFKDFLIDFFRDSSDYKNIMVVLWDDRADRPVYDPNHLSSSTWVDTVYNNAGTFTSYRVAMHGKYRYMVGVTKEYTESLVKADIQSTIRNVQFAGNSFIQVNEIVNYKGGNNFAVCRINPDVPQKEGTYLSTETPDAKGDFPYKTELEAINQKGEVFYSYSINKRGKDHDSKTMVYSKLYKDYNWVISMGIYLDDLNPYLEQIDQDSSQMVSRLTFLLVLLFAFILAISLSSISMIENLYHRNSRKQMESEMNVDALTGADTRRSGVRELTEAFRKFKRIGEGPGVMMCDLDHFKEINDKYGHSTGDKVLSEFVKEMKLFLRSSDIAIRWGGDEFIFLLQGLRQEAALDFCRKFILKVSELRIGGVEDELSITVSVGISFFKESDEAYTDALKRADEALYQSKERGRNHASVMN